MNSYKVGEGKIRNGHILFLHNYFQAVSKQPFKNTKIGSRISRSNRNIPVKVSPKIISSSIFILITTLN